jgi:hypothetical protein
LKLKRIFVVFAAVAVMVATAAAPAMAQNADKAAKKAERQAARQAQKAAAVAGGAGSKAAPTSEGTQKALPSSGGMPVGNIALLGAGALLAGGGTLLYKKSAFS